YYEVGEPERARPYVEEAAKKDPENPDALYYLGLIRDEAGDARGALEAYLQSRAMDSLRAPVAWAPSPRALAQGVQQVVTRLDSVFAAYVREADVYIVDVPGAELVVDGVDPRALMLLETHTANGDPRQASGNGDAPAKARLFVYQRNIERAA